MIRVVRCILSSVKIRNECESKGRKAGKFQKIRSRLKIFTKLFDLDPKTVDIFEEMNTSS